MGRYYIVEPSEHKEYSIVFRLEEGVKEVEIPESISNLRDEIDKLQVILEIVFKDDETIHQSYYTRLIQTAQSGAGVGDPHLKDAMKDIQNMKIEIEERYLANLKFVKYFYISKVSLCTVVAIFTVSWILVNWLNCSKLLFEYPFVLLGTYIGMNLINFILPNSINLENVMKWTTNNKLLIRDLLINTLTSLVLYIFVKTSIFDVTILGKSMFSLLQSQTYPQLFLIVFGLIVGFLNQSLLGNLLSNLKIK